MNAGPDPCHRSVVENEQPKSFSKKGSLTGASMTQAWGYNESRHHGLIAGILTSAAACATIVLSCLIYVDVISIWSTTTVILCGAAKMVWIWACVHLALFMKVHPAWGFLGIFLLLGPAVILWCKIQSPNWEINKVRREIRKQNGKSASFTSK